MVDLNPLKDLTPQQTQILTDMKLDGHWLYCMLVNYMPRLEVDVMADRPTRQYQIIRTMEEINDLLYNDIVGSAEADGMNDDDLNRLEGYIEEYLPELIPAIQHFLESVYYLLSQMESPAHCIYNLNAYVCGFGLIGTHAGVLYFDFRENEDHHSFRSRQFL